MFESKIKLFKKVYKFLIKANGVYRKIYMHMQELKFFFNGKVMLRHAIIKFIFGPQQIFFQIFTKNSYAPDTHTTIGILIRIRENIREHGGKYIYRLAEDKEFSDMDILRTKKQSNYFKRPYSLESFRNTMVYRKLIKPKHLETKELKLIKLKK